jgi:UDP-N-acetylmuramyl pentapeptide phosphotransferase/UDP-N-acetylglucosamine-1-phosphate transferase
MTDMTSVSNAVLTSVAVLAGTASAGLIVLTLPWLKAYALARPNARSSHREPTPQGGGAAVIAATFAATALGLSLAGTGTIGGEFLALTMATALLAAVGAIDDIRPLSVAFRLVLQCLAVGLVIAAMPADWRVVAMLPWWIERVCLLLGGVWFINLTNFMDGIDWMTVAETVPLAGAVALLGLVGALPELPLIVAVALLGAVIGFAPFNKPVARLFLGDVGSLPIGLLLAWLLLQLAVRGHLAAALLLPLYYLADASLTLMRRTWRREPVWQAHRSHFYQRATDKGFSVSDVVARVFMLNIALAALAVLTVMHSNRIVSAVSLATGAMLVSAVLVSFARGKKA